MTISEARDRVIAAAKAWRTALNYAYMHAFDEQSSLATKYKLDADIELAKAVDALTRLESATPVSHPASNDTLDAPADVCECKPIGLKDFPVGTKAPAIGGGHWTKVERGWKWCTGAVFPVPGGDWNQELILPDSPPTGDVCECGHGDADHGLSASGNGRCWHICECPKFRPKQKGGRDDRPNR